MDEELPATDGRAGAMSRKEAGERLADMGFNSWEKRKISSPSGFFLNQLKCPIVFVLLTGIMLSTFMHGWAGVLIILTIILGGPVLTLAMGAMHIVSAKLPMLVLSPCRKLWLTTNNY